MGWTEWTQPQEFRRPVHVIYEKKHNEELGGGIARLTLNRPEVLNAFTGQTYLEYARAFRDAEEDVTIGAIILAGSGGHFSSGGDVTWEAEAAFEESAGSEPGLNRLVRLCPKVVIAAVEGYAIGGGNHLAYTCDITIAADTAIFGHNGVRVGSPHHGYTVALAALTIGMKRAKEMHFFLPRYTAQEAFQMGMVNKVVPEDALGDEVDRWCEQLLTMSPTCVQLRKRSFNALMEMMRAFTGPHGEMLRTHAPDFMGSAERKECLQAFTEMRTPRPYAAYAAEHGG
ncbi:MAG: 1,4-dihydroxy-6-naphthoate synthase [SAR202 cluster bacterium]|jgi:naphthoate synthase/2-ketocyclohexanecarboxyl-CoA hydrolase|nr:1,4-dihydroxy-6-naphthoate synthase [Chloroflexota bacterium]MDP6420496.1 enoyl-CoA hydratase-related protein [SAR202 cluster bacterium]HAL48163.1 1,4-dihydroxy-6-naphthoate synthase [Dehalococcoidia bacterium]MDP6664030.1 enoyl-CoA hydratase-related protein [SAR202 cluster bacterium]MDP6799161.1 enoyl-CoA hydratase-related protein [SAR202 cluster bacterium]|tara:strand:+ start:1108 stop:1962 length:855 start_codon:yes stop_codon:yes gene_type:complete